VDSTIAFIDEEEPVTAIEVKSVPNLAGTGVCYAYAVKAGPWIFMTGHEAFDFATGDSSAVGGPPDFPLWGLPRYRREGDYILKRMQSVLGEFGSSLSSGVRLDQYYPTTHAVDPYHLARKATFGDYIPPSTSVIMEHCFHREMAISTSLIAVTPSEEYRIERVYPKDVDAPKTSGFVPAITCNDFVFVAGQMATSESGGLDPRAHAPDFDRWGGSEIRKQTEFLILNKLKPALEAAGSSLSQAVKSQVYIDSIDHIPDFIDVWNTHFRAIPCALTVVPTKTFSTVGGIIEINMLGLKTNARRKKRVIDAGLPPMTAYGPCVQVGEFLLPSGLMALEPEGIVAGAAVSPSFGALSHAGAIQADRIYRYAEALCSAANTSMENLLRAHYFMPAPAEFPGVTAAWVYRYGRRPHPFCCVHPPAPLAAPGAAMIADFWIYAP
jgi:enamine deaminase RidA (YjgF/YER057c/UK114 family)